jgi:hypothetical protein
MDQSINGADLKTQTLFNASMRHTKFLKEEILN